MGNLEREVFGIHITQHSESFGMEISAEKSGTKIFLGHCPVRCKFVVDNKCLHEVKNLKYFGCEICYGKNINICRNTGKYDQHF